MMSSSSVARAATVLVVDDDQRILRLVSGVLEREGFEVLVAGDAAEALALAGAAQIDVVLTDVMMPKMTGADLARELWRRGARTPVIYMTGSTGVDLPTVDGAPVVVRKPFQPQDIVAAVAAAVRRCDGEPS
ncbi:MAG: response regulator [Deltaproteobacteria bacterium]|nr:MAG: response regulator [Deltaproteobacteria bacterium]